MIDFRLLTSGVVWLQEGAAQGARGRERWRPQAVPAGGAAGAQAARHRHAPAGRAAAWPRLQRVARLAQYVSPTSYNYQTHTLSLLPKSKISGLASNEHLCRDHDRPCTRPILILLQRKKETHLFGNPLLEIYLPTT